VPVLFGHLETVWLSFEKPVETDDIGGAWQEFECAQPGLPSLPLHPVVYSDESRFPQSKMSFWGSPSGMQVFTGRLRKERERVGFSLLVNNLVKGAAGGAIANAELFLHTYGHVCGLNAGGAEVNHEKDCG
jgi:aspartate-semialdehyde dehydrogenase